MWSSPSDLDILSVAALKQLIASSGLSHQDCLEKRDLIIRAREALVAKNSTNAPPTVPVNASPPVTIDIDADDGLLPPAPAQARASTTSIVVPQAHLNLGKHDCGACDITVDKRAIAFTPSLALPHGVGCPAVVLSMVSLTHVEVCKIKGSLALWGTWEWEWSDDIGELYSPSQPQDDPASSILVTTDSSWLSEFLRVAPKCKQKAKFVTAHTGDKARQAARAGGKRGAARHDDDAGGASEPHMGLRQRRAPLELLMADASLGQLPLGACRVNIDGERTRLQPVDPSTQRWTAQVIDHASVSAVRIETSGKHGGTSLALIGAWEPTGSWRAEDWERVRSGEQHDAGGADGAAEGVRDALDVMRLVMHATGTLPIDEIFARSRRLADAAMYHTRAEDDGARSPPTPAEEAPEWVQCDRCDKWRKLQPGCLLPSHGSWFCEMSEDTRFNTCDAPVEDGADGGDEWAYTEGSRERAGVQGAMDHLKLLSPDIASGNAVLDHLRSTAAPINAQIVADAFRGTLGKSEVERHLQDLVEAGTVERKEAGKVVLYWASQKDVAPHGDGVHGLIMPNELRTAVGNGSVTGVATWLDSGGQIDCGWATRGNGYGITTLMLSCARGHLPVVDLLLERGASVDLQSSLGLSALMIAAVSGQPLVIRRLVSAGAQIDLRNRQGLNALQAAEVKGDNACVRILREHAAHLVHLQESADGDDHADVDNPVPKVTLRLCNPFADGAATHGKRRACDGSVLPPSKKAASGDATPRAATTEGAAKDPRTPFATTTPATGSADAEIVTVAAAPVAPAGAAVGMAALRADMRAELRAELRAEMRAEVEDEVRRESQHPSDGGIDAECDWEAAESHLSFATKILVWEQNQHRHREQRMRLHKLDDNHLNARVLRLSRSKLAPEVLAFFGVGSAGLKQWVSPAATKRMLSPIRVEFTQDAVGAGEEGIDEGGLSADLYDSFFSAVLANPTLFDTYDDGLPLPAKTARCHELGRPSPCGKCEGCAALHQLRAVGRVLAKQLLDGWVAPGPAPFVWHYLRESHESAVQTAERALDALERVDPMLSRTWRQMLILPIEVGTYGLTIENLTDNADDADTPLTDSNKREALRQACRQRLLLDRRPALEALHAGFAAGEHTGLYLWSVPELVQLMHGTSSFDLRALYAGGRNIIFDSTCAPGVRTMLTELLENGDAHEWGHEHARQLLQFCTAFSVLPPDDHDKSLRRKPIRVSSVPPDAEGGSELNTPTASTCGRELYVPEYPTLAALKERFEFAFEHMGTSGFQYS